MRHIIAATFVVWLVSLAIAPAQTGLLKQARDDSAPQAMSAAEIAQLNDPFFRLVLKPGSPPTDLDGIETKLRGTQGTRQTFVVSEDLQDSALGGVRRAVITFKGTVSAGGASVRLDPNVTLSVPFTDKQFFTDIEAWGWDDGRSRYNYYKLDGQPLRWKFRGSSVDADNLQPADRRGTCMACHINGGPVMKELPFPWNNWHSFQNVIPYLSASGQNHWSIAKTPRLGDLQGAQDLEIQFILPAIRQFNGRRLNALIKRNAAGQPVVTNGLQEITDAPRALRQLFRTTEYNIVSAAQFSGLHPVGAPGTGPTDPVRLPDVFFLDANLLAGGGPTQYAGLGIPEARQFGSLVTLEPAEYRRAVQDAQTKLAGQNGDANFAWFVPVPSHIDGHMVDLLVRRGVITPEFALSVMAIDLENPVFSAQRAGLLSFIPKTFRFKAIEADAVPAAHPDDLTKAVIASLTAKNPAPNTPEGEWLALLRSTDPRAQVRQKVTAALSRMRTTLGNPQQRAAEITRLYGVMVKRRTDAAAFLPALVESPRLFPSSTVK